MAISSPEPTGTRSTSLGGRTALVLGAAAPRGVVAATTLADLGAHVIVAGGDRDALEARYRADDRFDIRVFDPLSDPSHDELAAPFLRADVLVHCVDEPVAHSRSHDDLAAASCLGAIRRFAPAMAARRRGSIIAISSPRPTCAGRGDVPSPSRGALTQLVRSLATEMRPFGVRVNAIAPRGAGSAPAVTFLASDASAHVTGAVLTIEPGWSVLERLDEAPIRPASSSDVISSSSRMAEGHRGLRAPLAFPGRRIHGETATEGRVHERRRA